MAPKTKEEFETIPLTDQEYEDNFGVSRDQLVKLIITHLSFKHPGEIVEPDDFVSEINRIHRSLWLGKMKLEEILPA